MVKILILIRETWHFNIPHNTERLRYFYDFSTLILILFIRKYAKFLKKLNRRSAKKVP